MINERVYPAKCPWTRRLERKILKVVMFGLSLVLSPLALLFAHLKRFLSDFLALITTKAASENENDLLSFVLLRQQTRSHGPLLSTGEKGPWERGCYKNLRTKWKRPDRL